MGKPHPMELRPGVVAPVTAGNTHHCAAARFDMSVKFVNDMVKLKRETGSLAPKPQGNPGIGKLTPHEDWGRAQVGTKGEITLDEMASRLQSERGVSVDPSSVWRLFRRLGLTHKVRRIRKGPSGAFPRRTTCKRLNRSAPRLRVSGTPSWRICWNALALLTKPGEKPIWRRPPAERRAGNGWSITPRSAPGARRPSSLRDATTGSTRPGS